MPTKPKRKKTIRKPPKRGTKLTRQEQYESLEWKQKREKIFQRDNYTCQGKDCPKLTTELHCHHIRYPRNKPIFDCPDSWLISLCTHCHSKIHGRNLGRKVVIKKPKL